MDLVKYVWNIKISHLKPKKSSVFLGILLFSFLLETFSTLLTMHCLKCLFHMNKHINKVVNVMFVENVSMWNVTSENISKKSTWLFWVPSWRYQYIWQLLQNQKVLIMASYSNNHYWSYTFLNPWALSYNRVVIFDFWQKPKIFFKILHCQPKFKKNLETNKLQKDSANKFSSKKTSLSLGESKPLSWISLNDSWICKK